ncbi:hypothetical protein [Blastomonas sp. CCH1-A6]|uniref:hypothetical protein n=1 Tax=Blastomonas sp. CCH1-A6 TaxID=1768762 RepID=UPI000B2728A1
MSVAYFPGMKLEDLPIPHDVAVTRRWPDQLVEMADHIGAYDALRVVERFGGQKIYVAVDPERNCLREVLNARLTRIMSHVYGRQEIDVPVARAALTEARRAPIIASVRNGDMTVAEAARILGTARTYVSQLVNRSKEAADAEPLRRPSLRDPRQIEMFEPWDGTSR